jgi:hypothetical protein
MIKQVLRARSLLEDHYYYISITSRTDWTEASVSLL